MKFRPWKSIEIANGKQAMQWCGVMLGSMITTLPSIIMLPIGALIVLNCALVDEKDQPVGFLPFFIFGFAGGLLIWIIALTFG